MSSPKIFITRGTDYIGSLLIGPLVKKGLRSLLCFTIDQRKNFTADAIFGKSVDANSFLMFSLHIISFLLLAFTSFGQKISLEKIGSLPGWINESSGLAVSGGGKLWTLNDGGGGNKLYEIRYESGHGFTNEKHSLSSKTWLVANSENHDWEDLATGDSGTIYIGDFGNNTNRRRDLVIYKVIVDDSGKISYSGTDSFSNKGMIFFHYPDQHQFPPLPSNWNFDCEGFYHWDHFLYLFSKNTSNPNDGFTKMYRLPDQPGNYAAVLIDSFALHEPVTAADISADGQRVVLLTYFSLWVFSDFAGDEFLKGHAHRFPIKGFSQKEAIAFSGANQLLITDERKNGKGGKLYSLNTNLLNLTEKNRKFKHPVLKEMAYNFFNNPRQKYRKVMRKAGDQ